MKIRNLIASLRAMRQRLRLRRISCLARLRGRKPVHFLHIGKTGGTAIKQALQTYPSQGEFLFLLHPHRIKLRDIPGGDGVIFLLRDPVSRFVSGFYSRKRQGQPRILSPWSEAEREAFEIFESPEELALALDSPDQTRRQKAVTAMNEIAHVRESFWDWFQSPEYFARRRQDIWFIGFQERLVEDFERFRNRFKLPDGAVLPDDEVNSHRNPQHLNRQLSAQASENLQKWYQRDYEFIELCKKLDQSYPNCS